MASRTFDPALYAKIMAVPEGLQHEQYRKQLGKYVTGLAESVKEDILRRWEEIADAEHEWMELNELVLLRLGFGRLDSRLLRDKRLDSPGMRNVIRVKAEEIKKEGRRRRRK